MRKFRPSVAALAVTAVLAAPAASAQFSGAYIFGDSLSDAGQYGSRFTTNPGLTFPMYLALRYGLVVTPSFTGGTDFAQGGARVNSPSPLVPSGVPDFSVAQQVSQLLGRGPLDPNALYQIQGGPNDVFVLAGQAALGQITPADVQAGTAQAAVDLTKQVARLVAGGARYVVVYNMPDLGKTPGAAAQGQQATLSALAGLFNSTLNAGIANASLPVIQVNTSLLLNEIIANPGAYGFTNVTLPGCTTSSALQCTPSTLVTPNAAQTFFFADAVHPTTATAQIAAQAAASMIEGPAKIGILAELPLSVEQATFRAIDGRMMSSFNQVKQTLPKYEAWVAYDYGNNDWKSPFVDGNSDQNTIAVGFDSKLSPAMFFGAAFGYTENKGDFGGNTGHFKLKETSGTVYAGYGMGPWYVGGTVGVGDLDYSDVSRDIQLGALTRTETGQTKGWHAYGSVLGGYWFTYNELQHGPFARLRYQDVHVHAYAENGADSTALQFGEQRRKSFISSLGWQGSMRIGAVRPFARVEWEWESKDDDRFVSATPVALSGTYSIPTIKPDSSWGRYLLGVSFDVGRGAVFVTGEGTSSRDTGNGYGITVGLRMPLS
jgi:outer membrane lipase/esterase